jgi:hypothetical protein
MFGSRIRVKELFLTLKIVSKLSEKWSEMFIPDPNPDFFPSRIRIRIFSHPGSRYQKKYRIPDPDSQHCTWIPMNCAFFLNSLGW